MKKVLSILLVICLCLCFSACEQTQQPTTPTVRFLSKSDYKVILETFLEPQVEAYRQAFGIADLEVDIQFKKCNVYDPLLSANGQTYSDGSAICYVRDVIISPTISQKLDSGEFNDELLQQLSAIEFEYPEFYTDTIAGYEDYAKYEISAVSSLACPVFADQSGMEYVVSDGILLKGNIITYISENVNLEYEAHVGDDINVVINNMLQDSNNSDSSNPSGTKCPNCKGSGYVKYYYGSSDLEAYLNGYDPYTVGKCTTCNGKGYY